MVSEIEDYRLLSSYVLHYMCTHTNMHMYYITGLPPRNSAVLIEDAENDGPVETERVNTDGVYLYLSACWIVFVLLVHLIRFHFIQSCLSVLKARLRRAILGGAD